MFQRIIRALRLHVPGIGLPLRPKYLLYRTVRPLLNPAAYVWRRLLFNTTFIAISGSVGKTTTKELLYRILKTQYRCLRTPGSLNAPENRGVAISILLTRPWHKFAIVEMAAGKPGDIAQSSRLLRQDVSVLLNVTRAHTNTFKTLEAIADEKLNLVRCLGPNGIAVVNQDNRYIAEGTAGLRCRTVRFGSDALADVRLVKAQSGWPKRLTMAIETDGGMFDVETGLLGSHWTPTVLAALATAQACGVAMPSAAAAVQGMEPFWARMQPVTLPSGATIVRDELNGSIDTFSVAVEALKDSNAARKIVIFSDYSDTPRTPRQRARNLGQMAAEVADLAVFIGDYAERSVKAATAAGLPPGSSHGFFLTSEAVDFLRGELRDGDLALLKGRSNNHLSRVYLGLLGPVACNVVSCRRRHLCDRCPDLGLKWTPALAPYMAPPGSRV